MGRIARANKVDANQPEIFKAYEDLGFSVHSTAAMGKGFPDLVVGIHGITDLVEVKDGSKIPSARKLTPDQVTFFNNWKGSVRVVNNVEDVAKHHKELREIWFA